MTEKQLQSHVLRWLDQHGIYYVKTVVCSRSGVPDCLVCVGGEFVALEFKSDTGKVSNLQVYNGDRIKKSGGYFFVVTPKNYCDVTDLLLTIRDKSCGK